MIWLEGVADVSEEKEEEEMGGGERESRMGKRLKKLLLFPQPAQLS